MGTSILLQGVDTQSCKADESAFLQTVALKCHDGSYLHSLFTPEMVKWVEDQIRDDGCPDLMAELVYERKLRQDEAIRAGTLATQLNDCMAAREKDSRSDQAAISGLQSNLDQAMERIRLQSQMHSEEMDRIRERLHSSRDEVTQLSLNLSASTRRVAELEQEMLNLKATMFDMMMAAQSKAA